MKKRSDEESKEREKYAPNNATGANTANLVDNLSTAAN